MKATLRFCGALLIATMLLGATVAQARSGRVQCFTVHAKQSWRWLPASKKAVEAQSRGLVKHWSRTDTACFGREGIPVYLGTRKQLWNFHMGPILCLRRHEISCGYHVRQRIVVQINPAHQAKAQAVLSHEIMEYLVDPGTNRRVNGRFAEVCDPVERHWYHNPRFPGVWLDDYVYPSFFWRGTFPRDRANALR